MDTTNVVSNYDNLKILRYVDVEFPDVWYLAINFVLELTDSLDIVGIVIGNLELSYSIDKKYKWPMRQRFFFLTN